MKILIHEVRAALALKLYMPGIISLFAIPDAAATVEYGYLPPSKRYPEWYDKFVDQGSGIDGKLAWMVRNALIHETAVNWRAGGYPFERLIIGIPARPEMPRIHGIAMVMGLRPEREAPNAATMNVELNDLAEAILGGASRWLETAEQDPEKQARILGMMQVRPNGFFPYVNGKPVIT